MNALVHVDLIEGRCMWTPPPSPSVEHTAAQAMEAETTLIAITYGYSRDHREDLKQWMVALATTHDGDVPLFLQPLDGNSSDKVSLLAAVSAIHTQLREADGEPGVYVADNGIYSEANMRQLNTAGITWISRVSETSTEAKTPTNCATRSTVIKDEHIRKALITGTKTSGKGVYFSGGVLA